MTAPGRFSYETNYLLDDLNGVILDVEATPERLSHEIGAAKVMLDCSEARGFSVDSLTPPQAIAIEEDNPARHTTIIKAWLAVGLWEERRKARHLSGVQAEKVRHIYCSFSQQ